MKFNSFTQECTKLQATKSDDRNPKMEITDSWEKGGNLGQTNSLWHHIEMFLN